MAIPILMLRGEDGRFYPVPAIQGEAGPAGADGHTPVKGEDYFTEADKEELVHALVTALPKYTGEVTA